MWPLEGLPRIIHWVSNLMPITYAAIAVKAVVSKGIAYLYIMMISVFLCVSSLFCTGMGIGDRQVYEGIFITFGWFSLYLILAILIFRR